MKDPKLRHRKQCLMNERSYRKACLAFTVARGVQVKHIIATGCQNVCQINYNTARFFFVANTSMCVLSSHLFWTSGLWTYQPGSHRRKITQDFSQCHLPSAVLALIFLARRIQPFFSLVDREVVLLFKTRFLLLKKWEKKNEAITSLSFSAHRQLTFTFHFLKFMCMIDTNAHTQTPTKKNGACVVIFVYRAFWGRTFSLFDFFFLPLEKNVWLKGALFILFFIL